MPNNSLEAVFHRKLCGIFSRAHQGKIMGLFREAATDHRPGMMEIETEQMKTILEYFRSPEPHHMVRDVVKILDEWELNHRRVCESSKPKAASVTTLKPKVTGCSQPQAHPARCGCEEPRV